jgi:DNA-binding response OmpR family regulator
MSKIKKKILVADDDPAILEVITYILEDEGYEVKTTADGQTEKLAHEYLPDLILLDIWMSGMDGRNICRILKSQKSTMHIPIVMVSANRDAEKISIEVGADDFIAKPFEMEEMLIKVKQYTEKERTKEIMSLIENA